MFMMIKLKLLPPFNTMKAVRDLPGLKDLVFDSIYGLVLISPKDSLYVVRTPSSIDNRKARKSLSPEIIEFYGDTKIAGI